MIAIMNDQAILTDIAAGDERAFRQLFDHYAERLTTFAFSIVKSREASMEVVDEIFVKLWKQRSQAAAIQHIRTYLYTAVKNASLNYLSAKANRQIAEPFDFINIQLQDDHDPEQQLITNELFSKIRSAVEELPPRCKMIFKLVREDGLKYKEVADILNLSVNTVDAQMVIAVKRISEKVRGHFDFYPGVMSRGDRCEK
jgi:RNA polymerase sigma-70 factor (family 1)